MNHKMICFICEKDLKVALYGDPETPPKDATVWYAKGNYGTTVFDPIGSNRRLEAYICDECLKSRADRVYTVVPKHIKSENLYLSGIVDED